MLNALNTTGYILYAHAKNEMRITQKGTDKNWQMMKCVHKSNTTDPSEKVVSQYAFKNSNGRCFSNF